MRSPHSFVNDTMLVGKAISTSDNEAAAAAAAEVAGASVLAIDPATIEIVPISSSGEVSAAAEAEAETATEDRIQSDDTNGSTDSSNQYSIFDDKGKVTPSPAPNRAATNREPFEGPDFVNMFRGSAPYIANHRNTLVVYHVPGELLEWDGFPDLMDDIALTWLLGMKIVIVCGCRHQIDKRMREGVAVGRADDLEQNNNEGGERRTMGASDEGGGRRTTAFRDTVRNASVRVTDADTLRIVKEEAGYVRFEVERQLARALRAHGSPHAMWVEHGDQHKDSKGGGGGGVSGADGNVVSGNFYSAQPFGVIDGVDYMYTGFPRRVEVEKIRGVHASNDIVLLTSLGVSPSGEIFNVNSESLAANAAGALGASKVIYFAVRGTALVKNGDSSSVGGNKKIVQHLRLSDARNLLRHYRVKIHKRGFASVDDRGIEDSGTGGETSVDEAVNGEEAINNSVPDAVRKSRSSPAVTESLLKIGWATSALERGVKRAHIIAPTNGALLQELYTRDGSGTLISRDLYEGIRSADVNDVAGIYDLVDPLVRMGTLVPRPRSVMEKDIRSYYVYTRDDLIVATGQLKLFEDGHAEIGCLVVSRDYRSQGRGDAMLGYLERLCLQCGATKVFVLSTQTMEWFVERGFKEVTVDALPPSRRAVYNYDRRSKIYMKKIDGDRDLDAAELWWNR